MYTRVIVGPPVEPLTLAEVKRHVTVDDDDHDEDLLDMIVEARQFIERECNISIITQTLETTFDSGYGVAAAFDLPFGPVQSVAAVEYVDATGIVHEVTAYQSDVYAPTARVMPAYGTLWPYVVAPTGWGDPLNPNWRYFNAMRVRYIAGYAPSADSPTDYAANVPRPLKRAMKLLIGNWFENREATVTGTINTKLDLGVDSLLSLYRLRLGAA